MVFCPERGSRNHGSFLPGCHKQLIRHCMKDLECLKHLCVSAVVLQAEMVATGQKRTQTESDRILKSFFSENTPKRG